jgi:hypothetical protein
LFNRFYYLFDIAIESNSILTKKNSSELDFQESVAKRKRFNFVLVRFLLTYVKLFRSSNISFFKGSKLKNSSSKLFGFYSTENQKKTIDSLNNSEINSISLVKHIEADAYMGLNFFKSFFLIPLLWIIFYIIHLRRTNFKETVRLFSVTGEKVILAALYYLEYKTFLSNYKVTSVLIANDHSPETRSLIWAAKSQRRRVKCSYIQHGTVSNAFPELRIFDNAFLDGEYSKDTYYEISDFDTKCYLVGAIRLPHIEVTNNILNSNIVNIALNDTIDVLGFKELVVKIKNIFTVGTQFQVRFHRQQSEERLLIKECISNGIVISNKSQQLSDFLSTSNFLVTVSSGIVIDALKLGVIPIIYLSEDNIDYFEYLNHGVGIDLNMFKLDQLDFVSTLEKLRENAKYYDVLIGCDTKTRTDNINLVNSVLAN